MTESVIRRATVNDSETFKHLSSMLFESDSRFDPHFNKKWPFQQAGEDYFQSIVQSGICFIAETNGQPVGFIDASLQDKDATSTILRSAIGQIYVVPEMRRCGTASRLMRAYLSWCKEYKVVEILVTVLSGNEAAIRFYEAFGMTSWMVRLNGTLGIAEIRASER